MDPITTASLIHDRTLELQRTADQIRQERALISTPTVGTVDPAVQQARPAEPGRSPAKVGNCSPAEPAI